MLRVHRRRRRHRRAQHRPRRAKDDGHQPDTTKTNVDEAIGSGDDAELYGTLGTASNQAIWDTTDDECMPQLRNGSAAARWGDVEGHPWTTGMTLDYVTEPALWPRWLEKEKPNALIDQGLTGKDTQLILSWKDVNDPDR
ncbi:MAG: hypothetical protein QM733_00325 [Ilumatobacteraceae bacterium]